MTPKNSGLAVHEGHTALYSFSWPPNIVKEKQETIVASSTNLNPPKLPCSSTPALSAHKYKLLIRRIGTLAEIALFFMYFGFLQMEELRVIKVEITCTLFRVGEAR